MTRTWLRWDEALVLDLLEAKPLGMYGPQVVAASRGQLPRSGSIYVTLGPMVEAGWLQSTEVERPGYPDHPRRLYWITPRGSSARFALEREPRQNYAALLIVMAILLGSSWATAYALALFLERWLG